MIEYNRLPEHMRETARLYIERGIPGGSFFTAVASNNLMEAFARADDANTAAMRDWCAFFHCDAPIGCHGSPEHVAEWIERGGLEGINAENDEPEPPTYDEALATKCDAEAREWEARRLKGMV